MSNVFATIPERLRAFIEAQHMFFVATAPDGPDGHVNVSAFGWEHMGPTLGPLAARIGSALQSDEMKHLEAMSAESRPRLVTAYAEDDRIVISSRGDAGLGAVLGSLVSAQHLGALGHALEAARAHAGGALTK